MVSEGSSRILEAVEEKGKWDTWMGELTRVSGLVGDLPAKLTWVCLGFPVKATLLILE